MTARKLCLLFAVFTLSMSTLGVADAQACTSCGTPAVSYYQPATYTASYQPTTYTAAYQPVAYQSQPVAYQSYYPTYANTSWYPGYWMDRWSARAAAPRTVYTTAYQPAYAQPAYTTGYAGYATSYASYAPSYSYASSGCSSCTAGYAPSNIQQVTMMPVSTGCGCEPCGSACGCSSTAGCSSCGSSGVSQASYVESSVQPASGCSSCGQSTTTGSTTFVPQPIQGAPQGSQQQLEPTPAPAISPGQPVAPDRTNVNKPADTSVIQPLPATTAPPAATTPPAETTTPPAQPDSTPEGTGGATEKNNSTFVAPPLLLFNPQDKTAQTPSRVAAPVTVAIYERPVATSPAATKVSSKSVTWKQAQQDAVGWTSASH